ncbi:MAG: signal peptidase II [Verrucomicrobia bacterium]|nr:signal peptidase II [Verrucomicrobiota bacterium]
MTAGIVFLLDQLTKLWIVSRLPIDSYHHGNSIEIVPDFFYLVHIGNRGAAWGIMEGQGLFLAIAALVALGALFYFRKSLELYRHSHQWVFGLISGGILGNLLDRLLHGHVIDFLDFHLPFSIPYVLEGGRYPAFNIADSGIVVGVFTYLILGFLEKETPSE